MRQKHHFVKGIMYTCVIIFAAGMDFGCKLPSEILHENPSRSPFTKGRQDMVLSKDLIMAIPIKENPHVSSVTVKDVREHKSRMPDYTGDADHSAFDTILKSALSSGEAPDKEQICMLMFTMKMRMHERLFRVMSDDKNDGDRYKSFYGLMNRNVTGLLPDPSASKIVHSPQKNDDFPPKSTGDFDDIINHAADTFSVDPALIRGVIKAESNFSANSTSPKGAMGLMQLMPATARDLGVENPYDPYENIMGGTRYLKGLLDRYDGDVDRALAAYNWGMGNVEKYPSRLPRETKTYISRIKQYYFETKA
jgi:hypothetical protein